MNDSTRITIRIKKDLLSEFREIFPYRGELTSFLTRCMSNVCNREKFDIGLIKDQVFGRR